MKLLSITCPNCGAKLQTTPNAKMLTCDYCNCDVMIEDEVKRVRLVDAEQAGYEFEKGRRRAIEEAELEAKHKAEEARRLEALFMWITCPICEKEIKVKKELETTACKHCGNNIKVQLGANIRWARQHLQTENYRGAMSFYLKAREIDPNNKLVNDGIAYVNARYKYSFIQVNVPRKIKQDETLAFRFGFMSYVKCSGKEELYYYSDMHNIGHDGKSFWFEYPGYVGRFQFSTEAPDYVYKFLINAKQGIYD